MRSKHPSQVAREVLRACAALKIACRQTGFLFQAQRGNMTFNVELTGLDMGLHLVRVRRTAGEVDRAVLMTRWGRGVEGGRYQRTLSGSFSVVSKPIFVNK